MPKCSNCGLVSKHLSGPTGDLCSECLEYMGSSIDPNNYPNKDTTLQDIIEGEDKNGKSNNLWPKKG